MLGGIGLGFGGAATATSSQHSHNSSDGKSSDTAPEEDGTTVVEPEQGNVLMHIISQLRPGADLSRVVLPTFILEPRSMLERITNFMCHPEMLLPIPDVEDPTERFLSVVKFYLSGWHIRPPGVKKPLNPILGEIFTCYWDLPDNTRAYYVSEQTSHHPPKSSYFYMAPHHRVRVDGTLKPRSQFLGNSAASLMEGTAILSILNRGKNPMHGEQYFLTQPNMYARGILFGTMRYELGDHSFVRCPELGLVADIEFKTKGYWGGTYDAIGGIIASEETGEILYELSGFWTHEMYMINTKTGQRDMFFNAVKSKHTPPLVRPIEDQEERESQRLWQPTLQAIEERNHEVATDEKSKIEDRQRVEAAKREADGLEWHPRLFRRVRGGPGGSDEGEEDLEWILNANIDGATPKTQEDQIMSIFPIVQGQKPDRRMEIPLRSSFSGSRSSSIIGVTPGREYEAHRARSGNELTKWLNHEAHGQDNAADAAPYEKFDLLSNHHSPRCSHGKSSSRTERNERQESEDVIGDSDLIDFGQDDDVDNILDNKSAVEPRKKGEEISELENLLLMSTTATMTATMSRTTTRTTATSDPEKAQNEAGPLIDFGEELVQELPPAVGKNLKG